MTSETEGASTGAVDIAGKRIPDHQGDAESQGGQTDAVQVKVIEDLLEEARREKLEKLKAKRAVIQEIIDNLEG
jgi:hypothetical protein